MLTLSENDDGVYDDDGYDDDDEGDESDSVVHTHFVSSDRSSYSDDGLLFIRQRQQLFQIFTQSIDVIDVTSVNLSRLNSIIAIDVTRLALSATQIDSI